MARRPRSTGRSEVGSSGDVCRGKRVHRRIGEQASAWLDRDAQYFLHQALSTPCLQVISSCKGIYFTDIEGRRYMDFHGNGVHNVGYAHERVVQRIKEQIDALSFCVRRYTNIPAVTLAEKLAQLTPGDLGKTLLCPGGTIGVEIALRLARGYSGRHKTVSFWDSFHGATFGSVSVGGERLFRRDAGPLLPGTEHLPPVNCYRCPYGWKASDACNLQCAQMVRYVFEKEGDIGALVSETITSPVHVPPEGYWSEVRKACDDCGVILVLDEIPTAFGRTGRMFACEHFEVVPDILVLGKSMGGGLLPVAAVVARNDMDVLGDYAVGHFTHEKNPIMAAAALAVIEVIESEGLLERSRLLGEHALRRLSEMGESHRLIGDVRGKGLLLCAELVQDRETKARAVREAEAVMHRALCRGLNFRVSAGNIVTFSPPLTITREQLDTALQIFEESLTEVEADGAAHPAPCPTPRMRPL